MPGFSAIIFDFDDTIILTTKAQVSGWIGAVRSAIENGTHYRRDVILGEDANRTADHNGATVLTSLRNLANGIYELERERERTKVDTLRSCCQQQTLSSAWSRLQR